MIQIIGILNYNKNSFSDGKQYSILSNDISYCMKSLFKSGANILDIGISATSYNAPLISEFEESERLKVLLEKVSCKFVSIDSYYYNTIKYAVNKGVKYINDVNSGKNNNVLEFIGLNNNINYICMSSLILPANNKTRIQYINQIYNWIDDKIKKCEEYGIGKDRLVIDPGLGFCTDSRQSISILKYIKNLKEFGVKICIGHSRKSFFNTMQALDIKCKDIDTIASSFYMYFHGIDYIRIHNTQAHYRSLFILSNLIKQNC